jgi:hypothetical protein
VREQVQANAKEHSQCGIVRPALDELACHRFEFMVQGGARIDRFVDGTVSFWRAIGVRHG